MVTPTTVFPPGPFDLIYADPPWFYKGWSKVKYGGMTYKTMKTAEICAMPVREIAAERSVLLMWATWPTLPDAIQVMEAWGFRYVTGMFVWVKTYNEPIVQLTREALASGESPERLESKTEVVVRPVCGLGGKTKTSTEYVLLGVRGKEIKVADKTVNQVVFAERPGNKHSKKPAIFYDLIDRLYPKLERRIELFARGRALPKWTFWGDQAKPAKANRKVITPKKSKIVVPSTTEITAGRDQFGNRVGSVPSIVTELLQERSGHTWTAQEMVEAVTKVLAARGLPPLNDPRHVVTVLGLLKTNKKPPLVEQPGRGLFKATEACLAGMT